MNATTPSNPGAPLQLGFSDALSEPADAPQFEVTNEWLRAHSTDGHAWNAAQFVALGISWPPRAGWKASVIGRPVSELQRRAFESGRTLASVKCKRVAEPYPTPDLARTA